MSLLTSFSKILERIIRVGLIKRINNNGTLSNEYCALGEKFVDINCVT
jgi:hypothetical protein